ncbi:hypothetical protein [Ekhidna sp.]|uniref:hypothetical protein n=1 Tax=Ekhidna sp. TaxID=2608089 RepID=UPI003C7C9A15
MKNPILYCLILTLFSNCTSQTKTEAKQLYNEEFKWSIIIPEDFNGVSPSDWKKMQNKGANAIEDTYGEEVINQAKIIFVFKSGDLNYFESNQQPFDESIDGDYLESWGGVNEVLYETFKAQMPGTKLDSSTYTTDISGLTFYTFKMKIDYPNGLTLNTLMYSRLFDEKEFSVNIMYMDEELGERMIQSWESSTFK